MSNYKDLIFGGIVTILVSLATYFISDYKSLKQFKKHEEEKRIILAEKKAVQEALSKMDSLYKVREERELVFRNYFDSTINIIKNNNSVSDSLTNTALKIATDSNSNDSLNTIYTEIKAKKL